MFCMHTSSDFTHFQKSTETCAQQAESARLICCFAGKDLLDALRANELRVREGL